MESQFSVSQSLQASTILQQQQQYFTKAQLKQQQQQQQQQQHLTLWQQLKLTAALFGVESATAFEQVYTYLSLQYLGVPVSLMALNGIVAGVSAVVLILVVGHLVDRGNNPKRRKLFALVFGLFVLVSGCLLVISACVLKIREGQLASISAPDIATKIGTNRYSFDEPIDTTNNSIITVVSATFPSVKKENPFNPTVRKNTSNFPTNTSLYDAYTVVHAQIPQRDTAMVSDLIETWHDNEMKEHFEHWPTELLQSGGKILHVNVSDKQPLTAPAPQAGKAYIPLPGVLGILGFICLDIGFDLGNPTCRAFILDHSPSSQHTHLLVTATKLASVAGLLMSCLGVFDLPAGIEYLFGVDGTSGTFIVMLVVILLIVVSFFGCSIWTGLSLRKSAESATSTEIYDARRPRLKNTHSRSNSFSQQRLDLDETRLEHGRTEYKPFLNIGVTGNPDWMWEQKDSRKEPDLHSTTTTDDKAPLLLKASSHGAHENTAYMTFSSVTETNTNLALPYPEATEAPESQDPCKPHTKLEDIPEHPVNTEAITLTSPSLSPAVSSEFLEYLGHLKENGYQSDAFLGSINETGNTQCAETSMKASLCVGSDGNGALQISLDHNNKVNTTSFGEGTSAPSQPKTPLFNKRLVILIISTAFSVSSLIGVVMYSSNAVALGIYKADPTAELGTPENLSYRQGLRTSALGNVVFYISYSASCILNNKSFEIFGEKLYNLISHGLFVIATTILIFTQRVEAYFIVMIALGPFRTCIFTLPYVLANKYTETKPGEGPADATRVGRVTATIGCTLPCVYIIVSSVMGPLIEATGNVWVPLIWTCIGGAISMVIFSILFCVKA